MTDLPTTPPASRLAGLAGWPGPACAACCAMPLLSPPGLAGGAAARSLDCDRAPRAAPSRRWRVVVLVRRGAAGAAQRRLRRRAGLRLHRRRHREPPAAVRCARMTITRSLLLFVLAALAEIGGAWLIWQGVREHRGLGWIGAGVIALGAYGFVATLQPDANFGRILAAYGGVFVAGSLAWGMVVDGFRPDR